jgi:hypothetical protein
MPATGTLDFKWLLNGRMQGECAIRGIPASWTGKQKRQPEGWRFHESW